MRSAVCTDLPGSYIQSRRMSTTIYSGFFFQPRTNFVTDRRGSVVKPGSLSDVYQPFSLGYYVSLLVNLLRSFLEICCWKTLCNTTTCKLFCPHINGATLGIILMQHSEYVYASLISLFLLACPFIFVKCKFYTDEGANF